jgi:hypothetical protein
MTCRLVLTTSGSGAGHLKMIRRGDKVRALQHRLVRDPVPAAGDMSAFFAERQSLHQRNPAQFGTWQHFGDAATARWFEDFQMWWGDCKLIEFWVDPDPNSQLILVQFIDWVGQRNLTIDKLKLVHAESGLGERKQDDRRSLNPRLVQCETCHLNAARLTWAAFRHATPELWAQLLSDDLSALPFLRSTVLRMLEELPAEDTGLGASELRILTLVANGEVEADSIFRAFGSDKMAAMLNYWEVGKVIDLLSGAPTAAIVGLEDGPFDAELHDDEHRYKRYMRSRLSLSPFGQALVERREDFGRHGRIDRWWGGAKLTNENCWRWRSAEQVLLKPT